MSRFIKLTALGALVVAVCAVAAGSASAATAVPTRYFVEGTELTTAETVDGAVGVAQLNSVVSGAKIMIECTANEIVATGNNTIEKEGKSQTEINYKQCYFYVISKTGKRELSTTCKVKEPINFPAVNQLILGPGGLVEDEFKHEFGKNELFIEITIENIPGKTCLTGGTFEVKGAYVASFGDEGEREMPEHELVFTSTGSKVKFGTELASYTNTVSRLKLKSGKSFS